MHQSVDVTGLPPEAVRVVQSLVDLLRAKDAPPPAVSLFDLIGQAPSPRTGDDIAAQLAEERATWGPA